MREVNLGGGSTVDINTILFILIYKILNMCGHFYYTVKILFMILV